VSPSGAIRVVPEPAAPGLGPRVTRFLAGMRAARSSRVRATGIDGIVAAGEFDPIEYPSFLLGEEIAASSPRALTDEWMWVGTEANAEAAPELPRMESALRWSWNDVALRLVGHEVLGTTLLFADPGDAVWRYEDEVGSLEVAAGSARGYLGSAAVLEEIRRTLWFQASIRVRARGAERIATALHLDRVEEASDGLLSTYERAGLWLIERRAHGPSPDELRIVGDDGDAIVAAARLAVEGGARARVETGRTGSREWLEALHKEGIAADPGK
jgi:hypothetical protein